MWNTCDMEFFQMLHWSHTAQSCDCEHIRRCRMTSLGSERLKLKKWHFKYLIFICFCTFYENLRLFQHDCDLQMTPFWVFFLILFAGGTSEYNTGIKDQHVHSLFLCPELWHVFKCGSGAAATTAGPVWAVWAARWQCVDLLASRPRVWGNDASGCLRGRREAAAA